MVVTDAPVAQVGLSPAPPSTRTPRVRVIGDLLLAVEYLVAALFVTVHLWAHLGTRMVAMASDEVFFMWALRHGARVVTRGENPFMTYRLNVPDGVNLIANTSSLALTLPMAPVTVLLGPRVSFAALLTVGLAGTAFAWYLVLRRVVGRPAAALGGAFCGFAPGMISHAAGHVNWVAQFVVPFLVLAVVRLTEPGATLRRGALLGLLATVQAFVNEEVLLYTAIGCAVWLLSYGTFLARVDAGDVRVRAIRLARGLPVAAAVAGTLLAYPLHVQFTGPQAYHGLPGDLGKVGSDLASYWSFSGQSWGGSGGDQPLALNVTEQNSFFGWPLLMVAAVAMAWLWTRILARAVTVTAVCFLGLSLGPMLVVSRRSTDLPMPWRFLGRLPLLEAALPTRFSLVLIPLLGVTLALIVQELGERTRGPARRAGYAVLACVLVPLLPLPIQVSPFPVTPVFVSSGHWKAYVPPGGTLVPVPDNAPVDMSWQADTDADFAVPGGYFLGPDAEGRGLFGTSPIRPSMTLFLDVGRTGNVPPVTDQQRRALRADLAYWRASAMVMPLDAPHAEQVRDLVDELTGTAGQQVDDVVVWRA